MYGPRFIRDFGESVPDVWRSAINSLKDHEVQRGLKRLANSGQDLKNLPQFVKACKQIGHGDEDEAPRPSHPNPSHALPHNFDSLLAFGNRVLLAWLMSYGPVSPEMLTQLVATKDRLTSQFRDIETEEPIPDSEKGTTWVAAFNKILLAKAA